MASPFERITIDGVTYDRDTIGTWADGLVERHRGGAWASDVRTTLRDLFTSNGDISVHTSGTTGAPKPLHIPATDLLASARITHDVFGLSPGDRALLCLPCEFIGGKMMLVRAMVSGLDLHLIDPRGGVLRNLRSEDRFAFTTMVPMQLHTALQHDAARVADQFGTILLGGGPVSDELIERVQGLRVKVYHGYGSTETVTHVAMRILNGADRTEHFTAVGDVTFATDDHGSLIVRAPHLSVKEYETNDLVELMDATRFRWSGRMDNVILSGGRKIHPERLESMTAGVVPYPHFFAALPDERLGQCVVLVLETGASGKSHPEGVLDALKGMLYEHERPRRVVTVAEFVRTGSGKVDRERTLALVRG